MSESRPFLGRIVDSITQAANGMTQSRVERRASRLVKLLATLITEQGEATGAQMARRAVALYGGLDEEGRALLFNRLVRDFSPDPRQVLSAAQAYHEAATPENLAFLQFVAEPRRQEVFRRMNMAPGGTAALVALRTALLKQLPKEPAWRVIDQDLQHLFASWFNRGFLQLRRIDWNTPAAILEKLIQYEAVHAIQGFPDLKRRLAADRRCFAFFHPALPDDPLVFVEVAFTDDLPEAVGPILSMESAVGDPRKARCAVFYSITSCQTGLKGISFGNFLIKQVAEDLHAQLPNLKTFVTLSPIPGFVRWLKEATRDVTRWQDRDLLRVAQRFAAAPAVPAEHDRDSVAKLVAWYLSREWEPGGSRDPVARFHLGNGARLERINAGADMSGKGQSQSLGYMVNYLYDLEHVERNHQDYVTQRKVVSSSSVEKLTRQAEEIWTGAKGKAD